MTILEGSERLIADEIDLDPAAKTTDLKRGLRMLSMREMIGINSFWFGYQFYWFVMSIVIVPKQVEEIMGSQEKGTGLAIISFYAGILNLFVAVVFGALNDRFASRYGKRRLFIAGGTMALSASLLMLSGSYSLSLYGLGYICMTLTAIIASVPFNGLVADITPVTQKGIMSAIMGSVSLAGSLAGAIAGVFIEQLGITGMYLLLMIILSVTCYITMISCEEESSLHLLSLPPINWNQFAVDLVSPLYNCRDFRLVFISRFLFQLGIATVNQFLQYWIGDCVSTTLPSDQAVSMALIPLLVLAPIAAVFIPKKKRKIVVYFSAFVMIITCILLEIATSFYLAVIIGGLFGIGYGPFISAEFAMMMDVLPSEEEAAKDIALWHSAMILPQIFATPAAGWMLDYYQKIGNAAEPPIQCLGYKVTYAVCVIYFLLGAEVTRRIKNIE